MEKFRGGSEGKKKGQNLFYIEASPEHKMPASEEQLFGQSHRRAKETLPPHCRLTGIGSS